MVVVGDVAVDDRVVVDAVIVAGDGVQGAWRAFSGIATAAVVFVFLVLCGAGSWVVTRSVHPRAHIISSTCPLYLSYPLSMHSLNTSTPPSFNPPSQYTFPPHSQ